MIAQSRRKRQVQMYQAFEDLDHEDDDVAGTTASSSLPGPETSSTTGPSRKRSKPTSAAPSSAPATKKVSHTPGISKLPGKKSLSTDRPPAKRLKPPAAAPAPAPKSSRVPLASNRKLPLEASNPNRASLKPLKAHDLAQIAKASSGSALAKAKLPNSKTASHPGVLCTQRHPTHSQARPDLKSQQHKPAVRLKPANPLPWRNGGAAATYDDFLVDDDETVDEEQAWRKAMREITRYDPRKFRDEPADDSPMEASFNEVMAEERRSARLAREEDRREEMLEAQREQAKRERAKRRKLCN